MPIVARTLATMALLALALLAATGILDRLMARMPIANVDATATRYLETTMGRAIATFAVVRGLNGIISAAQGTELAVSPVGVGVTLTIGEVLDPLNDLAEQFSWIMLVSTTSLGIQRVLLEIGWRWGLKVLLPAALLCFLAGRFWVLPPGGAFWNGIGRRILLFALLVRFAIPCISLASDGIYAIFLADRFAQATLKLDTAKEDIRIAGQVPTEAPPSGDESAAGGRWRQTLEDARNLLGIQARIETIRSHMARLTDHIIDLIVVFTLQAVIIPLAIFWILLHLVRSTLATRP
jgi:hypothetical protein